MLERREVQSWGRANESGASGLRLSSLSDGRVSDVEAKSSALSCVMGMAETKIGISCTHFEAG